MVDAIESIRSAQWLEVHRSFGEHPHATRTELWIRLDPPARAWRGEIVEGGHGFSHDVIDKRGHLHTASTWTNYSLSPAAKALASEDLLREILAPDLPLSPKPTGTG